MEKISWTRDEQKQLLGLVRISELQRNVNWDLIASNFAGKTRQQCIIKYLKVLHFNSSDSERYHDWSDIEKEILFECVNTYGKNWDKICRKYFQWLTPLKLKNKHYSLTKQGQKFENHVSNSSASTNLEASTKNTQLNEDILNEVKKILDYK